MVLTKTMPAVSCPRCGYSTIYICNLHSHFERKIQCKPKKSDIPFKNLYQTYYNTANDGNENNTDNVYTNAYDVDMPSKNNLNKSYKCGDCEKVYKYRQSLYVHRKNAHSNKYCQKNEINELKKQMEELLKEKEKDTLQMASPA